MFVVLKGVVALTQRDGLGHVTPIAEQGEGQFLADVGQLSTRAALVDGTAEGDVETLLIPTEGLRALLVAEAELGERIMRALILRRVALLQGGAAGAVLIGAAGAADVIRLEGFLTRNGYPHHLLDPARDPEAKEVIGRYADVAGGLPLVVCPDGSVLGNPSEPAVSRQIGLTAAVAVELRLRRRRGRRRARGALDRGLRAAPKACRSRFSTPALTAVRPAPAPGSKTILAFRPE